MAEPDTKPMSVHILRHYLGGGWLAPTGKEPDPTVEKELRAWPQEKTDFYLPYVDLDKAQKMIHAAAEAKVPMTMMGPRGTTKVCYLFLQPDVTVAQLEKLQPLLNSASRGESQSLIPGA